MLLVVVLSVVGLVVSGPQNRGGAGGRRRQCPGREFVDLLPDGYTQDDYDSLLTKFKEFLEIEKLAARPDFVDFDNKECTPKKGVYRVEDPDQCDKYWECSKQGQLTEKICDDGFVYDIPGKSCNHPQRVECGERKELQEAQPTPGCPRRNGFFHDTENVEDCDKYNHCVNGVGTPGECSVGLVWSPAGLACTLPNLSGRPECEAAAVRNQEFTCPKQERLRFGNHDRIAHPTDCSKFYVCFLEGNFNKASCDKPTVFDSESGSCKPIEDVNAERQEECTVKDEKIEDN